MLFCCCTSLQQNIFLQHNIYTFHLQKTMITYTTTTTLKWFKLTLWICIFTSAIVKNKNNTI
jgi:hypothetical protein